MGIYVGTSEIKNIYVGTTPVKEVYVGTTKVRPSYRTFTISWTEKSNMSSGWTYSDDAAGMTAGSGDFDDFFGYSAVLLNTSGVETAEMTQSGGVFTGAMTALGNITSGDNVMIKFPARGIKMTKSGSVVTLSITDGLGRESEGYQYYAHCTGTINSPGTPKDAFYLGAYKASNNSSNVLKSWSGKTPLTSQTQATFCTRAKSNGSGYNIIGYYQRMYINALYMMKYGNPDSSRVVGMGYTSGSTGVSTGGTNSQTSATYGTSSNTQQIKLFGIEDWRGNWGELTGGAYLNANKTLFTQLSGYSGALSGGNSTGITLNGTACISNIAGDNKAMFGPIASSTSVNYDVYYGDYTFIGASRLFNFGGWYNQGYQSGAFYCFSTPDSYSAPAVGTRIMYL